ncbi:MAG: hypothetical protein EA383_13335 [Spirochaetaceae bacterium]|nr:MAG: hypothetical protein EA383_13335 [Spirochaetaceae bacterium]
MKNEVKKIAKIVDELLTYFLHHYNGASHVSVIPGSKGYTITMKFTGVSMTTTEFEKLKDRLVVRRQPELEDYYWQLAGEVEGSNEMGLVGMMCDSIEIERSGETIQLTLLRNG